MFDIEAECTHFHWQSWFWQLVSIINIYKSIKVNSPDLAAE